MAYQSNNPDRAGREVATATKALGSVLAGYRRRRSGIRAVTVRFNLGQDAGGTKGDPDDGPSGSAAMITITVDATTQEEAETCAADFEEDGATCTSTGETQVTCEYS